MRDNAEYITLIITLSMCNTWFKSIHERAKVSTIKLHWFSSPEPVSTLSGQDMWLRF